MLNKVVSIAREWIGQRFNPGVTEQCMAFVRDVLAEADNPLAGVVTKAAVDGLDSGFYLASSLAGRDVGQLVATVADLKPGAVVFFQDTYGNWPAGTITHVGIFIGDGKFVHRPTSDRLVEVAALDSGFWFQKFRCGLLLPEEKPKPKPAAPKGRVKLFGHSGRSQAFIDGKAAPVGRVVITRQKDGSNLVEVDGRPLPAAVSYSLDISFPR